MTITTKRGRGRPKNQEVTTTPNEENNQDTGAPESEPEEEYRECEIEHSLSWPGCFEDCPLDHCNGVAIHPPSQETQETQETPETTELGAAPSSPEENTETLTKPLTVEVHFPTITDLRQVVTIDKGTLILEIKYKVKLETGFELFRLANLLKHQGTGIYATLGSNQVAMDFAFHPEEKSIDVITPEEVKALQGAAQESETSSEEGGGAE